MKRAIISIPVERDPGGFYHICADTPEWKHLRRRCDGARSMKDLYRMVEVEADQDLFEADWQLIER